MADGGYFCRQNGTQFGCAQPGHEETIPDKFRKNLTSGLGGDSIFFTDGSTDVLTDVWTDAGQFHCGIGSTFGRANNCRHQEMQTLLPFNLNV